MRASHSGATFVRAYERETQQAFLEAHALAFEHFGGVFAEIKYDNLKAAVTKILRGRRRIEPDRCPRSPSTPASTRVFASTRNRW